MKTKIKQISLIIFITIGLNLNVKAGIGDFFKTIYNGVMSIGRPVWGSYTVSGQNNSAPIALFKRTTFEKDKTDIINRIKTENSDFAKIYDEIYKTATNTYTYTIPAATGEAQKYETRATFAKNAAFVLVLGVNQSGDTLRQGQKDTLAANILTVIRTADDPMDNDWFKKSTTITGWGQETQMLRAIELVNYCTALDLLRTAGYGWNNDRGHEDNPRTAFGPSKMIS